MSAINFTVEGEPGHESWEAWMDTEEDQDYHDGTIIGTGSTFEECRDNAIETLRGHITELETKAHPDLDAEEEEDEDDDDDEEDQPFD